jgi:hypothetical protein
MQVQTFCVLLGKASSMFALQNNVLRFSRRTSGRNISRKPKRIRSKSASRSGKKKSPATSHKKPKPKKAAPKTSSKRRERHETHETHVDVEYKLHYVLAPFEPSQHKPRLPTPAQFDQFYRDYLAKFLAVYEYKLAKKYKIVMFDKFMLVTMKLRVPKHMLVEEDVFNEMLFQGDDDGNYPTDEHYYFHMIKMSDSRNNVLKRQATH